MCDGSLYIILRLSQTVETEYDFPKMPVKAEPPPAAVAALAKEGNISLIKAWRLYRGLKQIDAATAAGMSQSAFSQLEKRSGTHYKKTLACLAKLYDCRPGQLVSEDT